MITFNQMFVVDNKFKLIVEGKHAKQRVEGEFRLAALKIGARKPNNESKQTLSELQMKTNCSLPEQRNDNKMPGSTICQILKSEIVTSSTSLGHFQLMLILHVVSISFLFGQSKI